MSRETAVPEYYVMLCARRYAQMAKMLVVAVREDERTQTKSHLTYILESGLIEFRRESERRLRAYPTIFAKHLLKRMDP